MSCHIEIEATDLTCCLIQSQYTDTEQNSRSMILEHQASAGEQLDCYFEITGKACSAET